MFRLWTTIVVCSFMASPLPAVRALAGDPDATKSTQTEKLKKSDARTGLEYFETRIRPVLIKHCYECHSAQSNKAKGGLLLDTREGIRRGGDSGHAIVPGSVADSLLIKALNYDDFEMPPDGQLSPEIIADFRQWIQLGAPDPRDVVAAPSRSPAKSARDLWSLKPIARATLPAVRDVAWPADEIDRFVLARLEAAGLRPVGDTDPTTLVRRVYFDLLGLPPPPRIVEAFVANFSDPGPGAAQNEEQQRQAGFSAYESLVDSLLASPQFGERWARHWLDVARFAESNGRDRDVVYHEAWRYRQYVIDALNADLPYDRFITEQLAGDLLPYDSPAERDRLLVATGFLAVGAKSLSGPQAERRMDLVDDQIDVTSRAILGLTIACARCHDHKFDPIPTRDYYALAGIFRSTETLFGPGVRQSVKQSNRDKGVSDNLQELSTVVPVDQRAVEREIGQLTVLRDEAFAEQRKWLTKIHEATARKEPPAADVSANRKKYLSEQRRLEAEIEALKAREPERNYAMAVCDAPNVTDCRVHIRGDTKTLGDLVERGFVAAVPTSTPHSVDTKQSGRLQLAAWLVDRSNPLPARVAANRVWMHLMGDGLVGTPDNFGITGEAPTHPELLDFLAAQFRDGGWSTKKLIRKIVLSRTYRLSATAHAELESKDQANELLGRHHVRRLDAESLRDAMLSASGKLDLAPPTRSLVAEMAGGEAGRTINMLPLEREFNHRSVYLPILRSIVPEMLKVFDFAEPSIVVGKRSVTTVPIQALFFLNSPYVINQADATAWCLLDDSQLKDDIARIDAAYLLIVSRRPTDADRQQATEFVSAMNYKLRSQIPDNAQRLQKAWSAFCQALFASAEFRYIR